MKKFIISSILAVLLTAGTSIVAQERQDDYLGLPGDNLNLYAVMKLFRESKTLETFENGLNDPKTNINNLDLNGDNYVDYIRVIDNVDGDVHNIVLQIAINERENQDVAVFTVQRFNNGQVQIQLTGDEDLYGKNYIIEPIFDDQNQTPNPGYTGNTETIYGRNVTVVRTTTYEIATWPVVRFIFLPNYSVWHSSWHWGYYPSYWHAWQPYYWDYYYGYHYNWYNDYYGYYRRNNVHRYDRWNDYYYTSRRSYSPSVGVSIRGGTYKTTYSRPELRKDGEEMFAKKHPEVARRTTVSNSGNNTVRRTDQGSTQQRQTTGNNSVRRTDTRSTQQGQNARNSTVTRRTNSIVTDKGVTNPVSNQNQGTTRRATTVNRNSENNQSSGQTTGTTRRANTVNSKSETNPPTGRTVNTNRSSASKSTVDKPTRSRSTTVKKSETTVKEEDKSKGEVKKDTRRK